MKTFDIETFERNKDGLNNYEYYTKDSTFIKQSDDDYEYYETVKPKDSYFQTINRYYPNGQLKSTVQDFPNNFLAGVMKEYDEEGNLIKETDYDAPFKFNWEDIKKLAKEKEIDLEGYHTEIERGGDEKQAVWTIRWEKKDETGLKGMSVDGRTGEILKEIDIPYPAEDYELPDIDVEDDQN